MIGINIIRNQYVGGKNKNTTYVTAETIEHTIPTADTEVMNLILAIYSFIELNRLDNTNEIPESCISFNVKFKFSFLLRRKEIVRVNTARFAPKRVVMPVKHNVSKSE